MKLGKLKRLIVALIACPSLPYLQAIEAPSDNASPPVLPQRPAAADTTHPAAQAPQATESPAEKPCAYLGVVTQKVPQLLADHLNLQSGVGVVVQGISPGGPAEKAGIQQGDVITALNGQSVGSSTDLTRMVANAEPGKMAKIQAIHQGKPVEIDVQLGTRPKHLATLRQPAQELPLDGVPRELADRVRGMIQQNLNANPLLPPAAGGGLDADNAINELRKQMQQVMEQAQQANPADEDQRGFEGMGLSTSSESVVRMLEPDGGSIELKSKDGSKEVTIRDQNQKITWSGPWDSEQDQAAAPAEVRQRLEKLNILPNLNGNGLRLGFGNAAPEEPPTEE